MKQKNNFIIKIIIKLSIFIIIASCTNPGGALDFEEPKIISVTPSDGAIGVDTNQSVKITFSKSMDKQSCESAFSLTSSGETSGSFYWENDSTLIYKPTKYWTTGIYYTISLERSSIDSNRNKLQKKHISFFYVGSDFSNPSVSPKTNNPYNQVNNIHLILYFTRPMDIASLQNSLSITPCFQYRISLNQLQENENPPLTVLRIDSNDFLTPLSAYTLTINTEAKSTNGLPMLRNYQYNFIINNDIIKPEILSVNSADFTANTLAITNQNPFIYVPLSPGPDNLIGKRKTIVFNFSEPMDRSSVESAFKIAPDVTGRIYWNTNSMVFYPNTGYTQNVIYKFYIDKTAKDLAGNCIDQKTNEYNFSLLDNPLPEVLTATFNPNTTEQVAVGNSGDRSVISSYNQLIEGIGVDVDNVFGTTDKDMIGKIKISILFKNFSNIDPVSLYQNVNITRVYGSGTGDPILTAFTINPPDKYEVTCKNIECKDIDPTYVFNTYKLEIKGGTSGIKDKNGNYMEKIITLYFKVNHRF